MAFNERNLLYREIHKIRKRPTISYVTSIRPMHGGVMACDAITEFCEQLQRIPLKFKEVDLLLVSNGGDPIAAWRIMSLLRERFENVGVLLPYQAFSAATLLAMGANEIIMHPFSNLGPVDIQLAYMHNGEKKNFGVEDLSHFFDFVKTDLGVVKEECLTSILSLIHKDIGGLSIGAAKRSSNLSNTLGQNLLKQHMDDVKKIDSISQALNKSFYHHGYAVGRREAYSIGLPVILDNNKKLMDLIWAVWRDFEKEMECSKPFNPLDILLQQPDWSNYLNTIPIIQIPTNLPIEIKNEIYNQIKSSIQIKLMKPVNYSPLQAVIESRWVRSEFRSTFQISASKQNDININMDVTQVSSGWNTIV
ncbi:MAG: hypothetical protein V1862_07105 [Methanobacteriota archaeon]